MKTLMYLILAGSLCYIPKATTTDITKTEVTVQNEQLISNMIRKVQPNISAVKAGHLAKIVYRNSVEFKLDPKILIAIIATESNFRNEMISSTGDFSMAQINFKIWNKEFQRLGLPRLDMKLLKHNEHYGIYKLAKILSILKTRYQKADQHWYASYHSQTPNLKGIYRNKLNFHLNSMKTVSL